MLWKPAASDQAAKRFHPAPPPVQALSIDGQLAHSGLAKCNSQIRSAIYMSGKTGKARGDVIKNTVELINLHGYGFTDMQRGRLAVSTHMAMPNITNWAAQLLQLERGQVGMSPCFQRIAQSSYGGFLESNYNSAIQRRG